MPYHIYSRAFGHPYIIRGLAVSRSLIIWMEIRVERGEVALRKDAAAGDHSDHGLARRFGHTFSDNNFDHPWISFCSITITYSLS